LELGFFAALYTANLHMHERGSRGVISILRANGDTDCRLQVDGWDHHWQGDYALVEPKLMKLGDRTTRPRTSGW
jgi:hypothetical protein